MTTKAGTSATKRSTAGGGSPRPSTGQSTRRSRKASGAAALPVREDEDPWTEDELTELRAELETERDRMRGEVAEAEHELVELMRAYGDGVGDDQADAGAATWEREHELSLTNNVRGLLEQTEHALERIRSGVYGVCEACGQPVGKMRLQAFPRATLCMSCKKKQERR